jgi:hypothetical protein
MGTRLVGRVDLADNGRTARAHCVCADGGPRTPVMTSIRSFPTWLLDSPRCPQCGRPSRVVMQLDLSMRRIWREAYQLRHVSTKPMSDDRCWS